MNQLSWLLYLAEVFDKVNIFFEIMMSFIGLGFLVWGIIGLIQGLEYADSDFWKIWLRTGWSLLSGFVVCFILFAMVPRRETVYAIAASEMGEKVLKTPLASKAEQALESWLDKQIATNKPASS